jgi:hypothetical protein
VGFNHGEEVGEVVFVERALDAGRDRRHRRRGPLRRHGPLCICRFGVRELGGRRAINRSAVRFNALDLSRWLLQEGLVELRGGLVVATERGARLGAALRITS